MVNKLQRVLDQADVNWSASKLLVNLTLMSIITTVGLALLQVSVVSCLAAGAGVLALPLLWLSRKRKKRINKMVEQLPDVFELMGQALRAGHALPSAIQLITEQMPEPIAGEFARVYHEQNLGIKVEEALLNMAQRVDQMDVRFFVTAVLIQRQTGGDLAEVLDKIGRVIRDRIQLFGTVQALTAEGRLSGWVLLALPVVVFFVSMIMNREYASVLLTTDAGRMMLGTAIAMDLMGLAMIKKIVNNKV
jgi:tight adherence protein B